MFDPNGWILKEIWAPTYFNICVMLSFAQADGFRSLKIKEMDDGHYCCWLAKPEHFPILKALLEGDETDSLEDENEIEEVKEMLHRGEISTDDLEISSNMSRGIVVGTAPDGKKKILLFYGRSPVFSNFYCSPFYLDGYHWLNTEQYFQYYKAYHFGDKKTQDSIKKAATPDEQKRLGRKVKNYSEAEWSDIREAVMLKASLAKFRQNLNERVELLKTIGMKLAEASPYDKIWGIGIGLNDPRGFDEKEWNGENLLGITLMKARARLRQEFPEEEST